MYMYMCMYMYVHGSFSSVESKETMIAGDTETVCAYLRYAPLPVSKLSPQPHTTLTLRSVRGRQGEPIYA